MLGRDPKMMESNMDVKVRTELDNIVRTLVDTGTVSEIFLFGSYAKGEETKDSDDDLDAVLNLAKVPYLVPACYLCGQAVEKILKAYYIAKENKLIKTHDLLGMSPKIKKKSLTPKSEIYYIKFTEYCININ
jgi:hypothetical protein